MWNDEKEARYKELQHSILASERRLDEGGFKLSEARGIALEMRKQRREMQDMLVERSVLDNETSEGQADNMAFNYLVSACIFLVYNDTETRFFKSLDDYLEQSYTEIGNKAATVLSETINGNMGDSVIKSLPENKFLVKYKFADEQLRLVNKDGKLVDDKGRLINENGEVINDKGELIDLFGNIIDKDGNYVVDVKPFLDDDGNPIVEEVVKKNTEENVKVES
jgi:hypothetical protein